MSDAIKHECGIALLRLRKPLEHYLDKYGTAFYGLNKLYLLMEKQHNRGQDGAGVANIKFDVEPGNRYISRYRSISSQPIQDVFDHINSNFNNIRNAELLKDVDWLKGNEGFTGELFMGHLRYGTFGKNHLENCHPFLRQNNWMTRNLVLAGNFNLTNVDELFQLLVDLGQHPKEKSDTITVLEKIGHFLDEENERLYRHYRELGYSKKEITNKIAQHLDLQRILQNAAEDWDGGYTMAGMIGHGDSFVLRDPSGIRPAYYYVDDEIAVVTSERPVIQTTFNTKIEDIYELTPGHGLIIKKNGQVSEEKVRAPMHKQSCSFERIYFSRGSDRDIYAERKQLGRNMVQDIVDAVDDDLQNSVFSFIPNTAEPAFYGMVKAVERYLDGYKRKYIKDLGDDPSDEDVDRILAMTPRIEKIAIKDAKLRTFITNDSARDDLVAHVYDITYGTVQKDRDNLVVIDDSIVRGTTLRQSILRILDRLRPKRIVVASSAPQIRYPDCYGIDMARLENLVAFQAAVELLKDHGQEELLEHVYGKAKEQMEMPIGSMRNVVKEVYHPFTAEQISDKISEILRPDDLNADLKVLYQSIEGLHHACPDHQGDWYFTGDYPTPGGNKVVNQAYINYMEGVKERAY
jgi:amidophosphoribosyltransferase